MQARAPDRASIVPVGAMATRQSASTPNRRQNLFGSGEAERCDLTSDQQTTDGYEGPGALVGRTRSCSPPTTSVRPRAPRPAPGTFTSVADLRRQIERFVNDWNQHPQPFVWTATAESILAKLERLGKAICGQHTRRSFVRSAKPLFTMHYAPHPLPRPQRRQLEDLRYGAISISDFPQDNSQHPWLLFPRESLRGFA